MPSEYLNSRDIFCNIFIKTSPFYHFFFSFRSALSKLLVWSIDLTTRVLVKKLALSQRWYRPLFLAASFYSYIRQTYNEVQLLKSWLFFIYFFWYNHRILQVFCSFWLFLGADCWDLSFYHFFPCLVFFFIIISFCSLMLLSTSVTMDWYSEYSLSISSSSLLADFFFSLTLFIHFLIRLFFFLEFFSGLLIIRHVLAASINFLFLPNSLWYSVLIAWITLPYWFNERC